MHALARVLDLLFPPRPTERAVRDAHEDALAALLSPASVSLPDGTMATTLFPFTHPLVHAFIVEAKYYGNRRAHALLGRALADYLGEYGAEDQAFAAHSRVLVPVPLAQKRHSERGYNQVEEVCRRALPLLQRDWSLLTNVLSRTRDTRPQTELSRQERLQNVQGAFSAQGVGPLAFYVVIDDVLTTGATLAAAAGALRAVPVPHISCIALAHKGGK